MVEKHTHVHRWVLCMKDWKYKTNCHDRFSMCCIPLGRVPAGRPSLSFLAEIHDSRKCCQISSFHSSLSLKQFSINHATWSSIETLFPWVGRFQYKEFKFENVSVGYASLQSQDHQSAMIVESYFSKAGKQYVYFQRTFWVELLETAIECTVKCIG